MEAFCYSYWRAHRCHSGSMVATPPAAGSFLKQSTWQVPCRRGWSRCTLEKRSSWRCFLGRLVQWCFGLMEKIAFCSAWAMGRSGRLAYEVDWLSCLAMMNLIVDESLLLDVGRKTIQNRWRKMVARHMKFTLSINARFFIIVMSANLIPYCNNIHFGTF